ncbi:hypothetical protein QUF58_00880 [Anaerolineales bacterium HSG24]|nr:hypothetical protein [Anaerolineales bacterium HSG24]
MAAEIKIVEITFDPKNYRGGNIAKAEKQLAQLINDGWRIVTAGGAGMGHGYANADYRSYSNEEMGVYEENLTGFVILQREKPKPSPNKKQQKGLSQDVQKTMREVKALKNRPKTKDKLRNYLDHRHDNNYIDKVINTLQNSGFIDKDGRINYEKI